MNLNGNVEDKNVFLNEESIDLRDNLNEQPKISPEIITRINPQCDLSQSFLTDPSKVAEFNKNLCCVLDMR